MHVAFPTLPDKHGYLTGYRLPAFLDAVRALLRSQAAAEASQPPRLRLGMGTTMIGDGGVRRPFPTFVAPGRRRAGLQISAGGRSVAAVPCRLLAGDVA
jgi:hypothetical protein